MHSLSFYIYFWILIHSLIVFFHLLLWIHIHLSSLYFQVSKRKLCGKKDQKAKIEKTLWKLHLLSQAKVIRLSLYILLRCRYCCFLAWLFGTWTFFLTIFHWWHSFLLSLFFQVHNLWNMLLESAFPTMRCGDSTGPWSGSSSALWLSSSRQVLIKSWQWCLSGIQLTVLFYFKQLFHSQLSLSHIIFLFRDPTTYYIFMPSGMAAFVVTPSLPLSARLLVSFSRFFFFTVTFSLATLLFCVRSFTLLSYLQLWSFFSASRKWTLPITASSGWCGCSVWSWTAISSSTYFSGNFGLLITPYIPSTNIRCYVFFVVFMCALYSLFRMRRFQPDPKFVHFSFQLCLFYRLLYCHLAFVSFLTFA